MAKVASCKLKIFNKLQRPRTFLNVFYSLLGIKTVIIKILSALQRIDFAFEHLRIHNTHWHHPIYIYMCIMVWNRRQGYNISLALSRLCLIGISLYHSIHKPSLFCMEVVFYSFSIHSPPAIFCCLYLPPQIVHLKIYMLGLRRSSKWWAQNI